MPRISSRFIKNHKPLNAELIQEIVEKTDEFSSDKRLRSRFRVDLLRRLAQKLAHDTDPDIENDLHALAGMLHSIASETANHKTYFQSLKRVKIKAEKRFGYVPKGYLKKKHANDWMGSGVAIGVALGASFNEDGTQLAMGIALGVALGAGVGQSTGASKEKAAEAKGLTY